MWRIRSLDPGLSNSCSQHADRRRGARQGQVGRQVRQRRKHEPALGKGHVRNPHARRFLLEVSEGDDVQVQLSRPQPRAGPAASARLKRLRPEKQPLRTDAGYSTNRRIEKWWLVEHPERRCLVHVGNLDVSQHHPKACHGRTEIQQSIAYVRAEPDQYVRHAVSPSLPGSARADSPAPAGANRPMTG